MGDLSEFAPVEPSADLSKEDMAGLVDVQHYDNLTDLERVEEVCALDAIGLSLRCASHNDEVGGHACIIARVTWCAWSYQSAPPRHSELYQSTPANVRADYLPNPGSRVHTDIPRPPCPEDYPMHRTIPLALSSGRRNATWTRLGAAWSFLRWILGALPRRGVSWGPRTTWSPCKRLQGASKVTDVGSAMRMPHARRGVESGSRIASRP